MKLLVPMAITAALLVALGCPGRQHWPDASLVDAGAGDGEVRDGDVRDGEERDGEERDGEERDGDVRDGGEDAGPMDSFVATPRCPSYADQLTLRVAKQTRVVGLIDAPVQSASSDDPETVEAELIDEMAWLRAQAAGSALVRLEGASASATVAVEVDLDDDHFATAVREVQYGTGAGFGQGSMPTVVLGSPQGRGAGAGSLDVVSLGLGGSITVELGVDVVDGPGADLIVFENPFSGFYESGEVAVSLDGVDYVAFPCTPVDPYTGCAGVNPVQAHVDNEIDPTDPLVAGGDAFDLGDIDVARARYVRITDVGGLDTGGGMAGFDLDAVVAIHALPRTTVALVVEETLTLETLALDVGALAAPRFDLTAGARTLFGIPTRCSVAPAGVVELSCACALRGLSSGQATLTARLGDLETTVLLEVGP